MIPVNKDWEVLCDAAGSSVALDQLLALTSIAALSPGKHPFFEQEGLLLDTPRDDNLVPILVASRKYEDWPPGPRQLKALRGTTLLYLGTEPSRIDLLIQGNPHPWTSDQQGGAQALMSSLGITDLVFAGR